MTLYPEKKAPRKAWITQNIQDMMKPRRILKLEIRETDYWESY